ncbi:hypothetical protein ACJ41O_014732 [Fusarium nematophilum]
MSKSSDWDNWFEAGYPKLDGSESGLVTIFARRSGELELPPVNGVASDAWLEVIRQAQQAVKPASLVEKPKGGGLRTLRTLPFSKDLFTKICTKFYIHDSIARVISRADIPAFSTAELDMGGPDGEKYPAFVYNFRSSNAWDGDLALSATYFPHCGLTFAVLFGCPVSVEAQILRYLSADSPAAGHPLLMSGIVAEFERKRHVRLVDDSINDMETRILQLDDESAAMEMMTPEERAMRKKAKRTAWLDTMYLRNHLISQSRCLEKIFDHADELNQTVFRKKGPRERTLPEKGEESGEYAETGNEDCSTLASSSRSLALSPEYSSAEMDPAQVGSDAEDAPSLSSGPGLKTPQPRENQPEPQSLEYDLDETGERMRRAGQRIKDRVREIIDEYQDKIRDCGMRVDGMAMATQWAQGETNVEIALAASRDSRHMRSIAVVTMIFLPGTFFASIFSMGFFDWNDSGSAPIVSRHLWIYVVLAIMFTAFTLGCWWYFGVYRHLQRRKAAVKEDICFV